MRVGDGHDRPSAVGTGAVDRAIAGVVRARRTRHRTVIDERRRRRGAGRRATASPCRRVRRRSSTARRRRSDRVTLDGAARCAPRGCAGVTVAPIARRRRPARSHDGRRVARRHRQRDRSSIGRAVAERPASVADAWRSAATTGRRSAAVLRTSLDRASRALPTRRGAPLRRPLRHARCRRHRPLDACAGRRAVGRRAARRRCGRCRCRRRTIAEADVDAAFVDADAVHRDADGGDAAGSACCAMRSWPSCGDAQAVGAPKVSRRHVPVDREDDRLTPTAAVRRRRGRARRVGQPRSPRRRAGCGGGCGAGACGGEVLGGRVPVGAPPVPRSSAPSARGA